MLYNVKNFIFIALGMYILFLQARFLRFLKKIVQWVNVNFKYDENA